MKQYNDVAFVEKERTRKNFLSHWYLLHSDVVGMARALFWASLLALLDEDIKTSATIIPSIEILAPITR
jgi:hypothetical protein